MTAVTIAALTPATMGAAEALLDAEVAGRMQARLGQLVDVLALPGFIARVGDRVIGVTTYRVDGERAELAVIVVADDAREAGTGSRLVACFVEAATSSSCHELWLMTTNDNLRALRFYQRLEFRLSELHAGGVDRARQLKPGIPLLGQDGIPIRDELVLTRSLAAAPSDDR